MQTSAEIIRSARVRAGLSQEVLAVRAGLASSTIARIEQGKREPEIDTLRAIAPVLGVEVGDLMPEGRAEADLPPRLLSFLHLTAVTEPERRHLLSLAASDGVIDYADALRVFRVPASRRTREPEATKVELPANVKKLSTPKRKG